jgi:hypothetical protein
MLAAATDAEHDRVHTPAGVEPSVARAVFVQEVCRVPLGSGGLL